MCLTPLVPASAEGGAATDTVHLPFRSRPSNMSARFTVAVKAGLMARLWAGRTAGMRAGQTAGMRVRLTAGLRAGQMARLTGGVAVSACWGLAAEKEPTGNVAMSWACCWG